MLDVSNKKFHFNVGNKVGKNLCQIDIWLGDVLLTPIDNIAYLPQFIASMEYELKQLQQREINSDCFFLDLGPTTDDCSSRITLQGNIAEIHFVLETNREYKLNIEVDELISIYQCVINKLSAL